MADFFPERSSVAVLLLAAAGGAVAQQPPSAEGLDLSADTFEYDGGTSRVIFRGFRLRQGDVGIEAQEAISTSLESEHAEYTLSGDVVIAIDTATIESDEARFTIRDNRLSELELRGQPAMFEDRSPSRAEAATGGAGRIRYDGDARTLSLIDDAWLRVGASEITGCDLIYDIDQGTYRSGSSECDQPFRIRLLRPRADDSADDSPPAAP